MLEVRLLQKKLRSYNEVLEQHVRERTAELQESYLETIFTMVRAAEYKDEDTGFHLQRLSHYCRTFAERLGLDQEFRDTIAIASPMHDIGKIGISDHILLKAGRLTPDEMEVMKGHTTMGSNILGKSKSPYLHAGALIALHHHERWDGGGYPSGARGEATPLMARITHLCDIYDALRSKRPYKSAMDHRKAVDTITKGDGRTQPEHFDPALLDAFHQYHESLHEIFEAYADSKVLSIEGMENVRAS